MCLAIHKHYGDVVAEIAGGEKSKMINMLQYPENYT
jgi:hypothetical protein